MAAKLFDELGVGAVTAALVETTEWTKKIEHKIVQKSDGKFDSGKKVDPMFEFSTKGKGSADLATLLGTDGDADYVPSAISDGVTIITSVKNSQKNDDFNSFEVSGVNYPGATAAGS